MDTQQDLIELATATGVATSKSVAVLKDVIYRQNGSAKHKTTTTASAKSLQACATEIFNSSLKQLSGPKPLNARSGNETAVTSPKKTKIKSKDGFNVETTARCASAAIAQLIALDDKQSTSKSSPKLHLEMGLIVLAGKMISHKLYHQATNELCNAKRRLEARQTSSRTAQGGPQKVSGYTPLASTILELWTIKADFRRRSEVRPLLVNYHTCLLRIMVDLNSPELNASCISFLNHSYDESPSNVVLQELVDAHQSDAARAKCAKQLELLSVLIWSLVPLQVSKERQRKLESAPHKFAAASFQLRVLALELRKRWWELASHSADLERELSEPFAKCLTSLINVTHCDLSQTAQYQMANEAVLSLGILAHMGESSFSIVNMMCSLEQHSGCVRGEGKWAFLLSERCSSLADNHARKVAMRCTSISEQLERSRSAQEIEKDFTDVRLALQKELSGNKSDFEQLLQELVRLLKKIESLPGVKPTSQSIIKLAARYAQTFTKSYPNQSLQKVEAVIVAAVNSSSRTEDLLDWVTADTAVILSQCGIVSEITKQASSKPLSRAFKSSIARLVFGLVWRTLLLKNLRCRHLTDFMPRDIFGKIEAEAEACLLQWQFDYALELAEKPKYHQVLHEIVTRVLQRLDIILPASEYPLRRAVVALMVQELHDLHPNLVSDNVVEVWMNVPYINQASMGKDCQLVQYAEDINSSLDLAKDMSNPGSGPKNSRSLLGVWERILNKSLVEDRIYDLDGLASRLLSLASLFEALGDFEQNRVVYIILRKLYSTSKNYEQQLRTAINICMQSLNLGLSNSAACALEEAEKLVSSQHVGDVASLQYFMARAQYMLDIGKLDETRLSLEAAKELRATIDVQQTPKNQRRLVEKLHADVWHLQSRMLRRRGLPGEALAAAKRSVKIYNSIWTALEKRTGQEEISSDDCTANDTPSSVDGLTAGIVKLNLTSALTKCKAAATTEKTLRKGAAFWYLIPSICSASELLCELYCHHGLFNEADYYSTRSLTLCASMGQSQRTTRLYAHRCRFLIQAGQLQEAELCYQKAQSVKVKDDSLASLELVQAEGDLRLAEGSIAEAASLFSKCEIVLANIRRQDDKGHEAKSTPSPANRTTVNRLNVKINAQQKTTPRTRAANSRSKTGQADTSEVSQAVKKGVPARTVGAHVFPHVTEPLRKEIRSRLILAQLQSKALEPTDICADLSKNAGSSLDLRVQHELGLRRAMEVLGSNVTLGVVLESTLAFRGITAPLAATNIAPGKRGKVTTRKAAAKGDRETFQELLTLASNCLRGGLGLPGTSTIDRHLESSMTSNISLLQSTFMTRNMIDPSDYAASLEDGRSNALHCERIAASLETKSNQVSDLFGWPDVPAAESNYSPPVDNFQHAFIDILPRRWTAISLSLSADHNELYVARFHHHEEPFILRLPFSRQRIDDGVSEEVFNYNTAKAELEDIIQLSNYSCHNYGDLSKKGAKKKLVGPAGNVGSKIA